MHSESYAMGVAAGLFAGLLAVAVVSMRRRKRAKEAYDERQQRARLSAFASGYWVLACYGLLSGMFTLLTGIHWADAFMQALVGVLLSGAVVIVRCIWSDAYFTLQQRPRLFLIPLVLVLALSAMVAIHNGAPFKGGIATVEDTNLVVALFFVVILATMGLKHLRNRREGE